MFLQQGAAAGFPVDADAAAGTGARAVGSAHDCAQRDVQAAVGEPGVHAGDGGVDALPEALHCLRAPYESVTPERLFTAQACTGLTSGAPAAHCRKHWAGGQGMSDPTCHSSTASSRAPSTRGRPNASVAPRWSSAPKQERQ